MRKILITLPVLLTLCGADAAMAQDAAPAQKYPVCSRTVQDECVNPSQAAKAQPAKAMHKAHRHH